MKNKNARRPQLTQARSIEKVLNHQNKNSPGDRMCYKKLVIRATSGDSATIYPVKTIKHICIAKVRSSHKPSPQALMQLSGVAFAKTIARAIAIKVNKHAIAKEPGFHRSQKRERLFAL